MKKLFVLMLIAGVVLLTANCIFSQEAPETLLPKKVINAMINEVSGALPTHHIIEMGGYPRDRKADEYQGTYFESQYMVDHAKQYGFDDVHIETWRSSQPIWNAKKGELWITKPELHKVISYRDITTTLAPNSAPGTYSGYLVYVGKGDKDDDYEGKEIKGNFILGESSPSTLYRMGVVKYGAAGVIAYTADHPFVLPDKISWRSLPSSALTGESIRGNETGEMPRSFGFNLSMRMGTELRNMVQNLHQGENIEMKAIVDTDTIAVDDEVVTALIPGETEEEIVLTAHLFEGIHKQGANDNLSGSAAILEAGRTLIQLMNASVLQKPKRSLRFLWVPEISGTLQYLLRYPQERENMVANINLDMVGEDIYKNFNSLNLYMNPYSRAHCIDNIAAELFDWVGATNKEFVHNRGAAKKLLFPIFDPIGSRAPFVYDIEPFYGSSDHIVFLMQQFKIPMSFFNNWPDMVYHTSADRPDMSDPTQMKRACFLTSALAAIMADFGQNDFAKIAGVCYHRSAAKLTDAFQDEVFSIAAAPDSMLGTGYRDARYILQANQRREMHSLQTTSMFMQNSHDKELLNHLTNSLKSLGNDQQNQLKNAYKEINSGRGIRAVYPGASRIENELVRMVPRDVSEPLPKEADMRTLFRIFRGGRVEGVELDYNILQELRYFIDGKKNLLQIRNDVSAEYGPVPFQQVKDYFLGLEKQGQIELKK